MTETFLVLGTGTGVGKTWMGAAVLAAFRERGLRPLGLKPAESGLAETPAGASDWELLGQATGVPCAPLHAFGEPISPHLAARREGREIRLPELREWVEARRAQHCPGVLWLESAGAAFSPLGPGLCNADLVALFPEARLLLVAPDSLGVLHDVTATLLALQQRGLRSPERVILSGARPPDASTGTNAGELSGVVFPQLGGAAPSEKAVSVLVRGGDGRELARALLSSGSTGGASGGF